MCIGIESAVKKLAGGVVKSCEADLVNSSKLLTDVTYVSTVCCMSTTTAALWRGPIVLSLNVRMLEYCHFLLDNFAFFGAKNSILGKFSSKIIDILTTHNLCVRNFQLSVIILWEDCNIFPCFFDPQCHCWCIIQNAAARVVTGTRKFDHITQVLHQLHWLTVCQRITFKLAMITFKCLHGLAPSYLADVCTPVSSVVGRWQLRLANSGALVVPCTRTTIGPRDFAVAGPATWNSLLVDLRTSSLSRDTFAKELKTHLLAASALEVFSNWALYKLTYSFIRLLN